MKSVFKKTSCFFLVVSILLLGNTFSQTVEAYDTRQMYSDWQFSTDFRTYGSDYIMIDDVYNNKSINYVSVKYAPNMRWVNEVYKDQYASCPASVVVANSQGQTIYKDSNAGLGYAKGVMGDVPVRFADLNGDGVKEMIYIICEPVGEKSAPNLAGKWITWINKMPVLKVVNLKTGSVIFSQPLEDYGLTANMLLANLTGNGVKDIVIKNAYSIFEGYRWDNANSRYVRIWNRNFSTMYGGNYPVGHTPLIIDIDKDGIDEVITGRWCLHGSTGVPQTKDWKYMTSNPGFTKPNVKGYGNGYNDHPDGIELVNGTDAATTPRSQIRLVVNYGEVGLNYIDGYGNKISDVINTTHHWQGVTVANLKNSGRTGFGNIYDMKEVISAGRISYVNGFSGQIKNKKEHLVLSTNKIAADYQALPWGADGYSDILQFTSSKQQVVDFMTGSTISQFNTKGYSFLRLVTRLKNKPDQNAFDVTGDGTPDVIAVMLDSNRDIHVCTWGNPIPDNKIGVRRSFGTGLNYSSY